MKPKLSIWPLALVLLLTLGAATVTSIKWYNDASISQQTTLADGNIFSLQSTGPNAFKWAYASTLKSYVGASQTAVRETNYVLYSSNYYAGDTIVNDYFNTNIFLDQSISNYFYTYSPVYETHQTNVTINEYLTQNTSISNTVITNIYASTVVSNWITTNVFPTTEVYVTNQVGGAFIANLGGLGTNITLYGDTILSGSGIPGQFELYDETGAIPLAGFNGVYYWGNGYGLTNISAASLPSTVTLKGNTFNGASQLLQLTAGGVLPQLDGNLLTNLNVQTVIENNTFQTFNVTNLSVTNLTVQNISNTTVTVKNMQVTTNLYVQGTNNVNELVVTNGVAFKTNLWAGATNTLPMELQKQFYQSYTPCSVTGLTGLKPGFVQSVSLYLKNIAATNWTFLPPVNTTGTNHAAAPAITVTTNQWCHLWFETSDFFTNLIVQGF